jgi:enoyl-CoA hydratase
MSWPIERMHDHVAVVRMSSHRANVQNELFFADLDRAFDTLERDYDDCAVLLTSAGVCFSAGLDFESVFALFATGNRAALSAWFERYRATNLRIWRYPRPTVAAVNGHAYAGGLITALDCDWRVTVPNARFSLNEVPIGIPMPSTYLEIIRYAAGSATASLASLFGRELTAVEAQRLGLMHAIAEPAGLLDHAMAMARAVPPDAFKAYASTKRALQAPVVQWMETAGRTLDEGIFEVVTDEASIRARAQRYEMVKGHPPAWALRARDQ